MNEHEVRAGEEGAGAGDQGGSDPQPRRQVSASRAELLAGDLPVVTVAASAQAPDSLEAFFAGLPQDFAAPIVVTQEPGPIPEGFLIDLIRKTTTLVVERVEDGTAIESRRVYVAPTDRDLTVEGDRLRLSRPTWPRDRRMPLDLCLRSLAQAFRDRAVCIILAASGTDGSLGVKAVKSEGGLVIMREADPARGQESSQPGLTTGLADFVVAQEEIPRILTRYLRHARSASIDEQALTVPEITHAIQKIHLVLLSSKGHDFSLYKQNTILRRVERRMSVNQIADLNDYLKLLHDDPREIDQLFESLLIDVTRFFRDRDVFAVVREKVLPSLMSGRQANEPLRIWVPGCSSGEEAYSIAILVREHLAGMQRECRVQMFATDIDSEAVDQARRGVYAEGIAADVPPEYLLRYFTKQRNTFQIKDEIREMLIFAEQNVIHDPPFLRLDLISCRNLLIYLGHELQKKVLPLFHYALSEGGHLLLGTSENIGSYKQYFSAIDRRQKVFRRKEHPLPPRLRANLAFPSLWPKRPERAVVPPGDGNRVSSIRSLVEGRLLERYAPPCVIINERHEILFIHGRTGRYIEPAPGEAELNILKMAREGLRPALLAATHQARGEHRSVTVPGVVVKSEGEEHVIDLVVKPFSRPPHGSDHLMVIFRDTEPDEEPAEVAITAPPEGLPQRVVDLEQELRSTKDYLQTIIEELETSNEELKATNEELQSSNEELQSTNEELEVSRQELQSMNEELVTVNVELELRVGKLAKANNDIENLLTGTEIGAIILDRNLCVQRYTPTATRIIELISSDVGRPLYHIANRLDLECDLGRDALRVMTADASLQRNVRTHDQCWFKMQINPYRTSENAVEGVVITFVDITDRLRLQEEVSVYQQIAGTQKRFMIAVDRTGRIGLVGIRLRTLLGSLVSRDLEGCRIGEIDTAGDANDLFRRLSSVIGTEQVWSGPVSLTIGDGERQTVEVSIDPIRGQAGSVTHWLVLERD